jgi:hypothetical protein
MEKNQTAQHQIIIASSEVQAMCLQKYYSILFASTQELASTFLSPAHASTPPVV